MAEPLPIDQVFLRKLTDIILANLQNENFGVTELAKLAGMSPSSINRRLQSINKKSINQFISEVRLYKALEMLRTGTFNANEVAYKVGFSSPAYFNTRFKKLFGYPPGNFAKITYGITRDGEATSQVRKSHHYGLRKLLIILILLPVLITGSLIIIVTARRFPVSPPDQMSSSTGRTSISIMPFVNMSNDSSLNYWQDGMQELLISDLSNYKELEIRQKESVKTILNSYDLTNYAALSPRVAGRLSKKLLTDVFIYGSINKSGPMLRVDAQLIDTKSKKIIQSFFSEKLSGQDSLIQIADTLSTRLKNYLLISSLMKENPEYKRFPLSTNSPEAFKYCLFGDKMKNTAVNEEEYSEAVDWYLKSLAIDSNYFNPMLGLVFVYSWMGNMEQNVYWLNKINQKKERWSVLDQLQAKWIYACSFEPPGEAIKYLKQMQQADNQTPGVSFALAGAYTNLRQYDKAIIEMKRSIEIYHRWGVDDSWYYCMLGNAYHKTKQYRLEKKLYRKAERYVKEDQAIDGRRVILSMAVDDSTALLRCIKRYYAICRKNSLTETDIDRSMAKICVDAGNPVKAEVYFRKALQLNPDGPGLLNDFAGFLSENKKDFNEFNSIIDKALRLARTKLDSCSYSETKGYGYFQFSKFKDALDILQRTWDSAPYKFYKLKSHLDEVKRAVAGLSQDSVVVKAGSYRNGQN